MSAGPSRGRWDRREVRRLSYEQRMEIERRVARGETGLSIAKAMRLRGSMQVSAVKKNPWPGGVLDKKGALANFEGDWIDEKGVVRPFVGMDKKTGKVIYAQPVKGAAHAPKVRVESAKIAQRIQEQKDAKAEKRSKMLPFKPTGQTAARVSAQSDVAEPAALPEIEQGPEADKGLPPAPNAVVGEPKTEDLGEALPEGGNSGRVRTAPENSVARIRRLSRRELPLKERVRLLAKLARKTREPQVALRAIQILNELDGLTAAVKAPASAGVGSGPLFQLPRDMSIGFAPVDSLPPNGNVESGDDDEPPPPDDSVPPETLG